MAGCRGEYSPYDQSPLKPGSASGELAYRFRHIPSMEGVYFHTVFRPPTRLVCESSDSLASSGAVEQPQIEATAVATREEEFKKLG